MVITIYLYVTVQNYWKKTVPTRTLQRDWLCLVLNHQSINIRKAMGCVSMILLRTIAT